MTYQANNITVRGRSVVYHDLKFEKVPITCTSALGNPYIRWVDTGMPQVPYQFLHCAFYLYQDKESALQGKNTGGTGFFISVPTEDGLGHHYGVTNWHVAVRQGFSCIRYATTSGLEVLEFDPSDWFFEPGKDDIAVIPLDIRTHGSIATFIATNLLLFPQAAIDAKISPGDDVLMIGRFIDLDARQTNMPAARLGHISTLPVEIEQPNGYKGECYVCDMHSRTGYSGSPVFVYRTIGSSMEWILDKDAKPLDITKSLFALLGVHCGQFLEELPVLRKRRPLSSEATTDQLYDEYIEGMSGMTCVIPAWRILDLLKRDDLKKLREKELKMRESIQGKTSRLNSESANENAPLVDPIGGDDILRAALNAPASPRVKPKAKPLKRGRARVSSK